MSVDFCDKHQNIYRGTKTRYKEHPDDAPKKNNNKICRKRVPNKEYLPKKMRKGKYLPWKRHKKVIDIENAQYIVDTETEHDCSETISNGPGSSFQVFDASSSCRVVDALCFKDGELNLQEKKDVPIYADSCSTYIDIFDVDTSSGSESEDDQNCIVQ
jgi:hypothetical protein